MDFKIFLYIKFSTVTEINSMSDVRPTCTENHLFLFTLLSYHYIIWTAIQKCGFERVHRWRRWRRWYRRTLYLKVQISATVDLKVGNEVMYQQILVICSTVFRQFQDEWLETLIKSSSSYKGQVSLFLSLQSTCLEYT